jgi:rRNA maturation endonuclease Nob1
MKEFVFSDGNVLPALIKCKNCKNHIYENWAFCPHCGKGQIRRTKGNKES